MEQVTMTTQEVANTYCKLAKENKWPEILDELCSVDLVNKEPEHVSTRGIQPVTKSLEAVKVKGIKNREMIEEIHSQECSLPLVAGNFFTVALRREVTFKGRPRIALDEIAVYEVKDGKIITEQFFY
ncbi:MAG: SnoaL-like domain-containing protein [Ferruginibacter sp.]